MTTTDSGLAPGSTFCYRVRTENSVTTLTSYSATVCGTTDPAPANLFIPQGAIFETQLNDPFTSAGFLHAGDPFSIAWAECNGGPTTAGAHASQLFVRGTGQSWSLAGTVPIPVLAPGACVRAFVQFPSGLPADQYDAAVMLDSANAVAESNESDNAGLMGFNILQ